MKDIVSVCSLKEEVKDLSDLMRYKNKKLHIKLRQISIFLKTAINLYYINSSRSSSNTHIISKELEAEILPLLEKSREELWN